MKACLAAAGFGAIVISGALAIASANAGAPAASPTVHRVYDIMRQGSKIGTNTFDIARQGDTTSVKIVSHVLVKIMFVTAYRYDHSETATWKGNQLIAFKSTTDDNGTAHEILAALDGGKVALTVDGERKDVPKTIAPASLWSADSSSKPQLFDPGTGKMLSTKAKDLGEETVSVHGAPQQLRHVKLAGEFDRDLWFDKDGLVKMTMLGTDKSVVTSELRQTTASR